MAEYITRKAVFEQFDNGEADVIEMYPDGSVDFGFGASNIRDLINAIPAADVAPVVRCRDCIYTRKLYGGFVCKYGTCSGCFLREDFFCANGTRKETRKDGDSDALG